MWTTIATLIRIVESRGAALESGVVEVPFRRSELPNELGKIAPVLASAGYRVIVPFIRGYGTTRFLSDGAVRNGQPSAIAVDTVALMDALKIEKPILAGLMSVQAEQPRNQVWRRIPVTDAANKAIAT